jgi:hypothetical protein
MRCSGWSVVWSSVRLAAVPGNRLADKTPVDVRSSKALFRCSNRAEYCSNFCFLV